MTDKPETTEERYENWVESTGNPDNVSLEEFRMADVVWSNR